MTRLRSELVAIVDRVMAEGHGPVKLDALAEAIGATALTSDEIGDIIDELERRGRSVGSPTDVPASALLRRVLVAARQLRAELGRTPAPAEIAGHAELSLEQVRLGLLLARVLQR